MLTWDRVSSVLMFHIGRWWMPSTAQAFDCRTNAQPKEFKKTWPGMKQAPLCINGGVCRRAVKCLLVTAEHKCDLHVHPIGRDATIFNGDFLFLDPRTAHVGDGIASAGNTLVNGILKTYFAGGADFNDFSDAHEKTP